MRLAAASSKYSVSAACKVRLKSAPLGFFIYRWVIKQ